MKFAEHLQAHLTPEWRTQYIAYDELKDFIYECAENAPPELEDVSRMEYFSQKDKEFFELCSAELSKINEFFAEKAADARRKLKDLEWELREYQCQVAERRLVRTGMTFEINDTSVKTADAFIMPIVPKSVLRRREEQRRKRKRVRRLHAIKLAYQEFYLNLILLQNYQTLNFTGFRKILKKHDKIFASPSGSNWRVRQLESAPFYLSRQATDFIHRVEHTYITELEQGDRQTAMKRLRVPPLTEPEKPCSTFLIGFFTGIFIMQLVTMLVAFVYIGNSLALFESGLRLFRSSFLVVLLLFLLGLNIYGWRAAGVNHVLIFEIDPHSHLTHSDILGISSALAVLWAMSLQLFLFSDWITALPKFAAPLMATAFMPVYLLNPLPVCQHRARRWLCRVLFRIATAPLHSVTFADFWLADQLCSLAILFVDAQFLICFYSTHFTDFALTAASADAVQHHKNVTAAAAYDAAMANSVGSCTGLQWGLTPIVKCLPAWFRFAQCLRRYCDMQHRKAFPHLVNAGKYSMTFVVTAAAAWYSVADNSTSLTIYILASAIGTIYSYAWDILMDWGLSERALQCELLRPELVFRHKWVYYVGMVVDLLLRATWPLAIGLKFLPGAAQQLLLTALAAMEIVRRFVWNFFRLENEHINNCGQFRAVRDIYIQPIRPRQQLQQPLLSADNFAQLEQQQQQEEEEGSVAGYQATALSDASSSSAAARQRASSLSIADAFPISDLPDA